MQLTPYDRFDVREQSRSHAVRDEVCNSAGTGRIEFDHLPFDANIVPGPHAVFPSRT